MFNEGLNTLHVWANDTLGYKGTTSVTFTIDTVLPTLELNSPVNTTYNSATQLLNISALDNIAVDTIWYNWNGSNVTYTSSEYIMFNEGLNTIFAWVNDSAGNIVTTSVTFTIDTTPPIVQIYSPMNTTYHSAIQLLNISASDNSVIDTIWYNWNDSNVTYTSTEDIMFNEGLNTIHAWANDSEGNKGTTSVTFTIDTLILESTFLSVWDTTLNSSSGSSPSNQVKLPLESVGSYDFSVKWGDGNYDDITSWNQAEVTHTYASEGVYTIRIDGTLIGWRFYNGGDKLKLLEIKQWGDLRLGNSASYFYGCSNLNLTATDNLDLTGTTLLQSAFRDCKNLGDTGNMSGWDVSSVTTMVRMFGYAYAFNHNISTWIVSNVETFSYMFYFATSFNQPIGGWDISNADRKGAMFYGAYIFNQDISSWDVSNVYSMWGMFCAAQSFNQDISTWNVSSATDMHYMFWAAHSFNQDISTWDVSGVTNMMYMFYTAQSFNQDISIWDVSSVTTMEYMFGDASSFDQNIGSWDVSSVIDMTNMFHDVTLSKANYDSLLIGWSQLSLQTGVTFDGGNSKYSTDAADERNTLTADPPTGFGWIITDGGPEED